MTKIDLLKQLKPPPHAPDYVREEIRYCHNQKLKNMCEGIRWLNICAVTSLYWGRVQMSVADEAGIQKKLWADAAFDFDTTTRR